MAWTARLRLCLSSFFFWSVKNRCKYSESNYTLNRQPSPASFHHFYLKRMIREWMQIRQLYFLYVFHDNNIPFLKMKKRAVANYTFQCKCDTPFFEIVFCLDPVRRKSVYDTGQTNYNLCRYGGAGRIFHLDLNRIILSRETIRFITR